MGWLRLTMHPRTEPFVRLEVNGVEIWVSLKEIYQGQARVAFLAPPGVEITRGTLLKRMGREGEPATRPEGVR